MKKSILSLSLFIGLITLTTTVYAQGMMWQNYNTSQQSVGASTTTQDEANGKAIWDKLQAKQTDCKSLTDDDYDLLGDYFMGLMMGSAHESMNNRMTQVMGDQGEKQMHIVMGKRFSGCDASASLPSQYQGFSYLMPMMGSFNFQNNPWNNNMMSRFGFPGIYVICWISLILVWAVLILSIVALVRYVRSPKRK